VTRQQRRAAAELLPVPDGAIDADDRRQVAGLLRLGLYKPPPLGFPAGIGIAGVPAGSGSAGIPAGSGRAV